MIGSMELAEIDLRHVFGTVGESMTKEVVTLRPDTSIDEAVATLARNDITGAPVIDDDRVVGVVTMGDLAPGRPHPASTGPFLRPAAHHRDWTVGDVMTRSPVVATSEEPLGDAIARMDVAQVDRLPVVRDDGRVVGWLTVDDVLHRVAATIAERRRSSVHRPLLLPD